MFRLTLNFLTIFTAGVICVVNSEYVYVCRDDGGKLSIQDSTCTQLVASAHVNNSINSTGWATLEVESKGSFDDATQAYAAGAAEGAATRTLIYWHFLNTVSGYCEGVRRYCSRLFAFMQKNLDWMQSESARRPDDPYWHQVRLILYQLSGLSDGYYGTAGVPRLNIDTSSFLMLQMFGDLDDLEKKLRKPTHTIKKAFGSGSCSAFIKPVNENKDLVFAHDTWNTYQSMLRILKLYKLPYTTASSTDRVAAITATFSSYPGVLLSIDDFYLLSSGLAVTETTIGNNNDSLLSEIHAVGQVPTWLRVQVANRLAKTGKQWVETFRKRNSGTYNNQWMLIDYKKFKAGKPLPKAGLFFVLEQIPYFSSIFNLSGSWNNVEKYGDWFTYDKTPRALIFKRDQPSVTDMSSLQKLMRYNDYRRDPLSRCKCTPPYSAENAISARCDLNPKNGTYPIAALGHRSHGGTDMKATNAHLMKKLQFVAISGPTYDDLPPFQWSTSDFASTTPHFAHPDLWRFPSIIYRWKTTVNVAK